MTEDSTLLSAGLLSTGHDFKRDLMFNLHITHGLWGSLPLFHSLSLLLFGCYTQITHTYRSNNSYRNELPLIHDVMCEYWQETCLCGLNVNSSWIRWLLIEQLQNKIIFCRLSVSLWQTLCCNKRHRKIKPQWVHLTFETSYTALTRRERNKRWRELPHFVGIEICLLQSISCSVSVVGRELLDTVILCKSWNHWNVWYCCAFYYFFGIVDIKCSKNNSFPIGKQMSYSFVSFSQA